MDDNIDQEIADMFADVTTEDNAPPATETVASTDTSTTSPDTEASENNNASAPSTESNSSEAEGTEPAETQETPEQSFSAEDKFNKQNKAFAEMRIKNKAYEDFLMHMAKVANIDAKTPSEAKDMLASQMQTIEAKQKQLDPAVLKDLEDKSKRISELESERLRERTLSDFAKLKALHGLSDADLDSFADLLISKNKNPFEQSMDLVSEYRLLNFDRLIEQAKEAGRAEEVARSAKAQTASTNPGDQRAAPESTGEQKAIEDVDALDAFFKTFKM